MKTRILDYINSTLYISLDDIAEFATKATMKGAKILLIPDDVILNKKPNLSDLLTDDKLVVVITGSSNMNDVLEALEAFVGDEDITDLSNDEEDTDDINEDDDEE